MGGLPQAPAGSVEDTADRTLAPVLDAGGGATRGSDLPVGADSDDATRGVDETPRRLVGGAVAPVQGATGSAGGAASDVAAGAQGAVDGPVRGVGGGVSDAVNAAPTGAGASVLPSVSQTVTNPTAVPSTLGG